MGRILKIYHDSYIRKIDINDKTKTQIRSIVSNKTLETI